MAAPGAPRSAGCLRRVGERDGAAERCEVARKPLTTERAMKRNRKRLIVCGVSLILGVLLTGPWWTARLRANPTAQSGPTVRPAPVGQRLGTRPGEKGATYYALEAQTTRLTTRFADAVAVAER